MVEYRVGANDRSEFLSAVDELGYARKRDGADAWGVYEDVADSGRFIETFSIDSWLEVLHQRERATHADEMLRSRVRQLLKEAPSITLGVSPSARTGIGESERGTPGLERVNQGRGTPGLERVNQGLSPGLRYRLELEFPIKHMQVMLCWDDEHMVGLED